MVAGVLEEEVVVGPLRQLKLGDVVEERLAVFGLPVLLPPRPRHPLGSKEYLEGMFAGHIP